jgi:preprotein translocase SecF subunit
MARRYVFFALSGLLILVSIASIVFKGLSFGIDFEGGIVIEVRTQGPADLAQMRGTLVGLELGEVGLQEFGAANEVMIRIQRQKGGEEAQQLAVAKVKAALGQGVEYRRVEVVGPNVSAELFRKGMYASILALFGIMAYVWFRFEWQFGLAGVIALAHDVISTVGLFSLLGLEFNLTTIAALLTIAGYSINDTVVIYDRIRENLRKYKTMPLAELFDLSINQTLSRTVITNLTVFLAVFALLLFGGEVLRGFSIAMTWGAVVGTYSTIFVASSLLLYFNVRRAATGSDDALSTPAGERT